MGFPFSGDGNFWSKVVVMVAHLCDYAKNDWAVNFKRMISTVCELSQ